MSHFKDRLWSDLVRVHGSDLSNLPRRAARPRRRPRVLAGTGLGLVAAGSATAILVTTAGTTPAFAVTKNNDGSVTVSIARVAGIPQANARLAALGLRARVVQVTAACGAPGAWTRSIHPPPAVFRQIHAGARFDPRQLPPGRLLVIPASRAGQEIRIHPGRVVHGQVPACLPPPVPAFGALGGACCPPPSFAVRPGRQIRGGPPWKVLAGPCPNARRQVLSRHLHLGGRGGPPVPIPGGPAFLLSGGPHVQISGGPHLRITRGRQLQITAGQPSRHGHGGTWIHISVSCPRAVAVPGPGQGRPRPNHH